jgi:hypothetical protein
MKSTFTSGSISPCFRIYGHKFSFDLVLLKPHLILVEDRVVMAAKYLGKRLPISCLSWRLKAAALKF